MASLVLYAAYARRRSVPRFVLVMLCFALGLMVKPMLVTFPFVLLLVDFWPLGRFDRGPSGPKARLKAAGLLALEKLPFFALSAAASAITFVFQRHTLSVVSLNDLPIATRLANVLVSYASYVGVMVWPSKLAAHYPFQVEGYSPTSIALSGALLACISITAFVLHRRAPYVIMGWLWFVGTLVPVVGFVQIGTQRMADRYSYLPSIGLSIMVA